MADPKDEILFQPTHLGKHFLVIQPRIPHKTDPVARIEPTSRLKGLFDLFVLTDKVDAFI